MKENNPGNTVLVVGGGIAGMQAALDLAAMNHRVVLLEHTASIGGNMARLDKTFPTNDCSTCMISPRMVACFRHPSIEILTLAELRGLDGEPGRFTANIKRRPRYVDEKVCIGCGLCVEKCPRKAPNAYNAGLSERKAIHFMHSQSIPMAPAIDAASCIYFQKGRCRACEKVCPTKAVRLEDRGEDLEVPVGAVILSAGYELALTSQAGEYGHGRYPNVVTGLEYERMLSATGPFDGHPKRPSDGAEPERIAWIQCVASRDSARNRNFCSSICCMAAVKQAQLTREHHPESEASIFFMDIRAHGKDFDRYVLRARDRYGVRFIRSMLSQVLQNPANGNLVIEYYDRDDMRHVQEEFDLVVLSAGLRPSASVEPLLQSLGLERNPYGFIAPDLENPSCTSREAVFVCGALDGPKDIPESVAGASAAAASAASFLKLVNTAAAPGACDEPPIAESATTKDYPQSETPVSPPRIGVFICHCGKNIAGVLDVKALQEFASTLPNVAIAENFLFTCSTQTQERIKELVREHNLNRVVVAACSPRTHEPLFQETLRQAGLNKYLFDMANIRDQCSWVHAAEPVAAFEKAKRLIRSSAARAALLEPIQDTVSRVTPRALVIGAGVAGMTAALNLADQGISVTLVEKEEHPGGMARQIHRTLEGYSPRRLSENLTLRVKTHRNITLYNEARLESITGGVGRFTAVLEQRGHSIPVEAGAVIVAAGGAPYRPTEYLYGRHPRVMTQLELENRLYTKQGPLPQTTVMIQCIGSRRDDFALCSRVCCSGAVKNAIRLMEENPAASVYVLYRDIRTFGFKEEYYRKARDLGAIFINFDPKSPPAVEAEGEELTVRIFDAGSRGRLAIRPDCLVLSSGVRPAPEAADLAGVLGIPTTQEGFFLEAHPKLSPLDSNSSGIFLCGLAHSPRFIEESLAQAKGAACRAAGLLLQQEIQTSGIVAEVDRDRCSSCLMCVYSCPYKVPVMDAEGVSTIDPRGCKGCGICAAECPARAITMKHYTDDQLIAQIKG
jgi:heterodisulfide reductase subunit A